jgi:hypothetical protein
MEVSHLLVGHVVNISPGCTESLRQNDLSAGQYV